MSDSDWEMLSTEGDGQLTSQPLSSASTTAAPPVADVSTAAATLSDTSQSTSNPLATGRHTVLVPLCLTVNQTGTRLGVGHTEGYLVFRVSAATTEDATLSAPLSTSTELPLPAQSQLTLDPQYNMDLLTFSHVRERMRQQRLRREHQQQEQRNPHKESTLLQSSSQTRSLRPSMNDSSVAGESAPVVETKSSIGEHLQDVREQHSQGPLLDVDDLGSFLATTGRAFTRMKRDDTHSEACVPSSAEKRESGTQTESRLLVDDTLTSTTDASHGAALTNSHGQATQSSTVLLQSHPPTIIGEPSLMSELYEDEVIDVDVSDGSANDLPLSSIGDSAWAQRHKHNGCRSTADNVLDDVDDRAAAAQGHMDHEEDESFIGFKGGGVAVMSFLYDQTWLALVGGGPTPMGPPNQIQFVRDGERQHQLVIPHPIVRLFLDTRILFVVTTAELRVYTNPLEHNWVCLRQRVAMSAIVAARYAAVPLATVETAGKDTAGGARAKHVPMGVWGGQHPSNNSSLASPSNANIGCAFEDNHPRQGSSYKSEPEATSVSTTTNAASSVPARSVALPSIPIVVDYARNLLLLPVGEEHTGFALYRYVTGPEPASRPTAEASPGSAAAAAVEASNDSTHTATVYGPVTIKGRTTAYLQHVATQQLAHKNTLHNLVLYVGWPVATTRLLATAEVPAATTSLAIKTAANLKGLADDSTPTSASRGAFERDRSRGRPVTLVAAASEYATRLTLWMLTSDNDDDTYEHKLQTQLSLTALSHLDPQNIGGFYSAIRSKTAAAFVLLREFRVGLRLMPPTLVTAALPGVSRFVSRGQSTTGTTSAANTRNSGHGDDAGDSTTEGEGTSRPTSAALSDLCKLPHDIASSSSYRSTFAAWASEAASVVATCASASPKVHHLQFIGNGAYLLCVHGTDAISVFSTSAPETEQEAKDVTRDRAVAEQNRYSRLSVLKEYLPKVLSNRLDAYTRQAWSSCSGHLPTHDPAFVPRWLYLQQQDAVAVFQTSTRNTSLDSHQISEPLDFATTALQPKSTVSYARCNNDSNAAGRSFFQRLSMLVSARPQQQRLQQTLSSPPRMNSWAIRATFPPDSSLSVTNAQNSQRASQTGSPLTAERALAPHIASALTHEDKAGELLHWGTPLTGLSQCICIWPTIAYVSHGGDSNRHGTYFGPGRRPIVLNCATCEGAFMNVFLFAEEGEVVTSRVVQYSAK